MTPEQYTAYTERLREIRSTLTEPKRIKFIDDILEALRYKDEVIEANHRYINMMSQTNLRTIKDGLDAKLKLEGCALRYGIPGWEIEKWLRMNPDQVVREVKFWQKMKQDCDELEGIKPEPINKPRYASKPIGLPAGYKIKPVGFSMKDLLASVKDC